MTATATAPAAATVHDHQDGGTWTLVAYAGTRDGWGIAITRWVTYRGQVMFEVHRVSPEGAMLRTRRHLTEHQARAHGNQMWRRDR